MIMKLIEIETDYYINSEHILGIKILNNGPCVKFYMSNSTTVVKCYTTEKELQDMISRLGMETV